MPAISVRSPIRVGFGQHAKATADHTVDPFFGRNDQRDRNGEQRDGKGLELRSPDKDQPDRKENEKAIAQVHSPAPPRLYWKIRAREDEMIKGDTEQYDDAGEERSTHRRSKQALIEQGVQDIHHDRLRTFDVLLLRDHLPTRCVFPSEGPLMDGEDCDSRAAARAAYTVPSVASRFSLGSSSPDRRLSGCEVSRRAAVGSSRVSR